MKRLITICSVCMCMLLATTAWGVTTTITFDENGHGSQKSGLANPETLFSGVDNLGGGPATLYYIIDLIIPMTYGDVKVMEPGTGDLSDVLRFVHVDSDNSLRVYVYSDNSDGSDSLADNGFPTTFQTLTITKNEVGAEGSNGLMTYTPTYDTEPGSVSNRTVVYNFTSDSVPSAPEPATICILGLGSLSLIRGKRKA